MENEWNMILNDGKCLQTFADSQITGTENPFLVLDQLFVYALGNCI
jgi:hypothetical protein